MLILCQSYITILFVIYVSYWALKKEMAAGSEPPHIRSLLEHLRPFTVGLSLCGAGAGGFAVVVLKRDRSVKELRDTLGSYQGACASDLSLHSVQLDQEGISVSVRECSTSTASTTGTPSVVAPAGDVTRGAVDGSVSFSDISDFLFCSS
jgi:hypothetical protein